MVTYCSRALHFHLLALFVFAQFVLAQGMVCRSSWAACSLLSFSVEVNLHAQHAVFGVCTSYHWHKKAYPSWKITFVCFRLLDVLQASIEGKKNWICLNCLGTSHRVKDCRSKFVLGVNQNTIPCCMLINVTDAPTPKSSSSWKMTGFSSNLGGVLFPTVPGLIYYFRNKPQSEGIAGF